MPIEERPAWLIRQENGVVAEARTRSLLVDRFWVLERSVDVDGADFIVQPRLTSRSLLDKRPPRLGFVQAKFYAAAGTTQYVHREYVVDPEGKPRGEFFLFCHTGLEDSARAFLLSAAEVFEKFKETPTEHSKPNRFALPGSAVLVNHFEIIDRGRALDRIERALRDADFYKNRSFLSWALPRAGSRAPVVPLYEEPIENRYCDIPSEFEKLRKAASSAQYDIREVLEMLCEIEETADPERALAIAEELQHSWGKSVPIRGDLYDEDFHTAVLEHKRRYSQLNDAGLLGAHAAIRRLALKTLTEDVAPKMPTPKDLVYVLGVRYDPETFARVRCETRFEKVSSIWPQLPKEDRWFHEDIPDTAGVLSAKPGHIEVFVVPGRYGYQDFERGRLVESKGPWSERIQTVARITVSYLCEKLLALRFGELS